MSEVPLYVDCIKSPYVDIRDSANVAGVRTTELSSNVNLTDVVHLKV